MANSRESARLDLGRVLRTHRLLQGLPRKYNPVAFTDPSVYDNFRKINHSPPSHVIYLPLLRWNVTERDRQEYLWPLFLN